MTPLDGFRDPERAAPIVREIEALVARLDSTADKPLHVMEICGGHTHAIFRYGLDQLFPPGLRLVHGPGCPVCVIPAGAIEDAIWLARRPGVVLATFGDALRVPGEQRGSGRADSLLQARAEGADVRIVYGPRDAVRIASEERSREVVFLAIGFETTAPATALALREAARLGLSNFSILCHHVLVVPPLRALLGAGRIRLDGFVGPGHVSAVIGLGPYEEIAVEHKRPVVVAGFEPMDVLHAVRLVVRQIAEGRAEVENAYPRVVRPEGNVAAQRVVGEVFSPTRDAEWRGLGRIEASGLQLSDSYLKFDASCRFELPGFRAPDAKACQCGEVLQGVIRPWECKVFGTVCTPETPLGACMVSSEGACAAYYNAKGIPGRTA